MGGRFKLDIENIFKNTATILATITTVIYVSGYLALRARAHALGTDPAFTLLDEGYVFAGFRFIFITLIVLLLLAPAILFVIWLLTWLVSKMTPEFLNITKWIVLILLAILTISFLKILSVNGLLLHQSVSGNSYSPLQEAVLGDQPFLRLALTLLTVFVTVLSFIWLIKVRLEDDLNHFAWLLSIIVFIQLCILPIYHGALFADHKVRVLASIPTILKDINAPIGIVDRTSSHVAILGRGSNNQYLLATIKLDDLNGIPVKKIINLNEFIKNDLAENKYTLSGANNDTIQHKDSLESNMSVDINNDKRQQSEIKKGFFSSILNFLNMTFEAFGSLSDDSGEIGQIWLVELNTSGTVIGSKRIGNLNNLSWPVMGPDNSTICALQDGKVIKLNKDGQPLDTIKNEYNWVKLFGVTEDFSILGMISDGSETKPAILSKDGKQFLINSPFLEDEKVRISILLQGTRSYIGDRKLFVERSERGGRGFDVFLKWREKVINVSDCGDDRCRQPSFSPDFKFVLFIKQPRY